MKTQYYINAKENNLGTHYIKVIATDTRITSSINRTNIKGSNRRNIKFGWSKSFIQGQRESVLSSEYDEQQNLVIINLAEKSEIDIELPRNLFKDQDLDINPSESISIIHTSKYNNENAAIVFDEGMLKFTGTTIGQGLENKNGVEEWLFNIECSDSHGELVELDTIETTRTVITPILQTSASSTKTFKEDTDVYLNHLFDISSDGLEEEIGILTITNKITDNRQLSILDIYGNELNGEIENDIYQIWEIEGESGNISM